MSRRRQRDSLQVIYWRDIPAQVTATRGADKGQALLHDRFQVAIDRAATIADKTDTEAYVAEWRKQDEPFEGDPSEAAAAKATSIDDAFPRERLEAFVANGGLDPNPSAP